MKYLRISKSNEKIEVGKIVCVGRNYAKHAEELGNDVPKFPLIFLKPASSLIHSGGTIEIPYNSGEMHHEVELVLVIGKTVKNANDLEAEDAITGYAVGLDMTLRDIQSDLKKKGHPWTLAKVFDGSAVISDVVLKQNHILEGNEFIQLNVNDELKQSSTLDMMLFNSVEIIKYISSKFTLEQGDLIYTGTPEGVGPVTSGQNIQAEISGLPKLSVNIK